MLAANLQSRAARRVGFPASEVVGGLARSAIDYESSSSADLLFSVRSSTLNKDKNLGVDVVFKIAAGKHILTQEC